MGRRFLIATLLCAVAVGTCCGSSPLLKAVVPVGAQRGSEVDIIIQGAGLADGQELLWYNSNVKVVGLAADSNDRIKARLAITSDCQLGPQGFRVRTASGISNLMTFSVGALPELKESEPNNDFKKPQAIAINSTVNGTIENEDVDHFVIEGRRGQRINLELEGLRLGNTFFDPYLAVLDGARFEVARCDDAPLVRQDCVCSFVVPVDGKYVVQIRESSFQGDGNCKYRLHLGTFPRPTAMLPYGGRPGETLTVRWLGDASGDRSEQLTLPASPLQHFDFFPTDEGGIAPSPNRFVVSNLVGIGEVEPNDTPAQGTRLTVPCAAHGIIADEDIDEFKFRAARGDVFEVRVLARELGSPLDPVLSVSRVGKNELGRNDDAGRSADCYVRVTIPDDDEYSIQIRDHLKKGGPSHAYRLEVAVPQPSLAIKLPEREPRVETTASVPRGNRCAILVGAERHEFAGDVRLEFCDLPRGVRADGDLIPEGRQNIPVLLTAGADAALSGRLANIIGRSTSHAASLEGRLLHRTTLVHGFENRDLCHFDGDRLPIAVVEEAPFSVDMVKPRAPLVRNGSLNLTVTATRKAGFAAPIALKMLYFPTGVIASNSIEIATAQSEAVLPLSATENAPAGNWKIVVLGEAAVDDKRYFVSTQLADLDVVEPFVTLQCRSASVEQGQKTELVVTVEKHRDWNRIAKVELLGLPHEVTTGVQEITKDTRELRFPLTTTGKSPPGVHKTLVCRVTLMVNGEPVVQSTGKGELRINAPTVN